MSGDIKAKVEPLSRSKRDPGAVLLQLRSNLANAHLVDFETFGAQWRACGMPMLIMAPWSVRRRRGITGPSPDELRHHMLSIFEPLVELLRAEVLLPDRVFAVYSLYAAFATQVTVTDRADARVRVPLPQALWLALKQLAAAVSGLSNPWPARVLKRLFSANAFEFRLGFPSEERRKTKKNASGNPLRPVFLPSVDMAHVARLAQARVQPFPPSARAASLDRLRNLEKSYLASFETPAVGKTPLPLASNTEYIAQLSDLQDTHDRLRERRRPMRDNVGGDDITGRYGDTEDPHIHAIATASRALGCAAAERHVTTEVSDLIELAQVQRNYDAACACAASASPLARVTEQDIIGILRPESARTMASSVLGRSWSAASRTSSSDVQNPESVPPTPVGSPSVTRIDTTINASSQQDSTFSHLSNAPTAPPTPPLTHPHHHRESKEQRAEHPEPIRPPDPAPRASKPTTPMPPPKERGASGVSGVHYSRTQERWIVKYFDKNDKSRPRYRAFSEKAHGAAEAKRMAIDCKATIDAGGHPGGRRSAERSNGKSAAKDPVADFIREINSTIRRTTRRTRAAGSDGDTGVVRSKGAARAAPVSPHAEPNGDAIDVAMEEIDAELDELISGQK